MATIVDSAADETHAKSDCKECKKENKHNEVFRMRRCTVLQQRVSGI